MLRGKTNPIGRALSAVLPPEQISDYQEMEEGSSDEYEDAVQSPSPKAKYADEIRQFIRETSQKLSELRDQITTIKNNTDKTAEDARVLQSLNSCVMNNVTSTKQIVQGFNEEQTREIKSYIGYHVDEKCATLLDAILELRALVQDGKNSQTSQLEELAGSMRRDFNFLKEQLHRLESNAAANLASNEALTNHFLELKDLVKESSSDLKDVIPLAKKFFCDMREIGSNLGDEQSALKDIIQKQLDSLKEIITECEGTHQSLFHQVKDNGDQIVEVVRRFSAVQQSADEAVKGVKQNHVIVNKSANEQSEKLKEVMKELGDAKNSVHKFSEMFELYTKDLDQRRNRMSNAEDELSEGISRAAAIAAASAIAGSTDSGHESSPSHQPNMPFPTSSARESNGSDDIVIFEFITSPGQGKKRKGPSKLSKPLGGTKRQRKAPSASIHTDVKLRDDNETLTPVNPLPPSNTYPSSHSGESSSTTSSSSEGLRPPNLKTSPGDPQGQTAGQTRNPRRTRKNIDYSSQC